MFVYTVNTDLILKKGDPAYNIPAGKLLQTCQMTGFAQNAQL